MVGFLESEDKIEYIKCFQFRIIIIFNINNLAKPKRNKSNSFFFNNILINTYKFTIDQRSKNTSAIHNDVLTRSKKLTGL